MKLSKLEKNRVIHISAMAIVCILTIAIFYSPKLRRIGLCSREIAGLRRVVEELTRIDSDPSEFNSRRDKIINDLGAIKEKFPSESMVPQVIEQITGPAKELGISLVSITPLESIKGGGGEEPIEGMPGMGPEAPPETGGYVETPIELSMQADYKQLGMYLDRLRHLPRLIVVKEFDVKGNKEIIPKLDIKIVISVFHYGKE